MDKFWERVKVGKSDECWEWQPRTNNSGYGCYRVGSRSDGTRRTEFAHRFSWTFFNGAIPDKMNVLHKCDNRKCVNPKHLYLGTQKQNVHDCINKGRFWHQKYRLVPI